MSHTPTQSIASHWFQASEEAGDFMGIRYGRIPHGAEEVEWYFVHHSECDGIGGFARILRERGAKLPELPGTKNTSRGVIAPLWRLWRGGRRNSECADCRDWKISGSPGAEPCRAVAWHLFTERETKDIRESCQRECVTVNSLLLKHLDQAIRPEIKRPQLKIPWMIPVNLRGDINHVDDTENHVSCVNPLVAADDSAEQIQKQIRRRLESGEHRAKHLILELGRFLSHAAKVKLLIKDRANPAGNIGAFSNLGVWDPEKKIATDDSWVFCPPVVTGQLLGAGCVTFQNRLCLAIQTHSGVSLSPDIAATWMKRWVEGTCGN